MPLKLSTTIGKIQNIPNSKNIEIIYEFLEYMRSNGSTEHHQNNNLKVCNNNCKFYRKRKFPFIMLWSTIFHNEVKHNEDTIFRLIIVRN